MATLFRWRIFCDDNLTRKLYANKATDPTPPLEIKNQKKNERENPKKQQQRGWHLAMRWRGISFCRLATLRIPFSTFVRAFLIHRRKTVHERKCCGDEASQNFVSSAARVRANKSWNEEWGASTRENIYPNCWLRDRTVLPDFCCLISPN